MRVTIVTTRHWRGDPRLNRHAEYLRTGGHSVETLSFADRGRIRSLISAGGSVLSTKADAVILPDPDFFAIGALFARIRGLKPVIDIHEDYPKVARNRAWIPHVLRAVVSIAGRWLVALGRFFARDVIVAAPQLSRSGDTIVLNVADPAGFRATPDKDRKLLVYVGDITIARGALDMLQALAGLPREYKLTLIGPVSRATRAELERSSAELGVSDRLQLRGRLEHEEAWQVASSAQFGLSLLQDTPAYREAVATKLWEYMASGVVPIVSDLPGQRALVAQIDPELACSGPAQVADLIIRLERNPQRTIALSRRARAIAEEKWAETRPDLAIQGVFDP